MQSYYPATIREEELKNRVAADFFKAYDCIRIVGNIDFCVSVKTRDARQMTFVPENPLLWAEAKNHPTDIYRMLAQLILTIRSETTHFDFAPPRFIGCFDNEKIAFIEYHCVLPVFNFNDFNWTQTPSSVDDKTVDTLRRILPIEKIFLFRFGEDNPEIKNFIRKNLVSGQSADLAMQIDKNNFIFVYQKWRSDVMPYIDAPWDVLKKKYALYDRDFFLAELNTEDNNTVGVDDDRPAVDFYINLNITSRLAYSIRRKNEDELDISLSFGFKEGGKEAYAAFWRRYKRPPKKEYWQYIVSRLDLLVPQDVRERKGSFFTPAIWVEKSQQYLAAELGENWQDEYYIWDCCAGTGNLLAGLTNKYHIWASTLDQQDVDVMRERISNGANLLDSHVFQFDFLNDSFDCMPKGLKEIIDDPEKRRKLVIYINPPYKEATNVRQKTGTGSNISGLTKGTPTYEKYLKVIGSAARELFALFLMRIYDEIPECIVGQFSTLKHLQSQNFKLFRKAFPGIVKKSFVVPADTFDNVKGKFPIGFFVWRYNKGDNFSSIIKSDVYDALGNYIGEKNIHSYADNRFVIEWLRQFYDKDSEIKAYLVMVGTDVQHSNNVFITSKPSPNDFLKHTYTVITAKNIIPMSIYMAIRHVVEGTWLNDRDQFLWPKDDWKADAEFQTNCLVWALFDNVVKVSDGVNHWIPFDEEEVEAKDCFQSHFMSDFLKDKRGRGITQHRQDDLHILEECKSNFDMSCLSVKQNLSDSGKAVLDAGRELWRYYHTQSNANPNASFYDIRLYFQGVKMMASGKVQMNMSSSDVTYTTLLGNLRRAQKLLAKEIEKKVYEYEFLKR